MVGVNYRDIKLNNLWQLTQATNGDAPIVSDIDCLIQDIKLEALTQEGELFFEPSYGWSLLDFIQREDDDLSKIEISERITSKLEKRTEIDIESLKININFSEEALIISLSFKLTNKDRYYSIEINLSRVNVEVVVND